MDLPAAKHNTREGEHARLMATWKLLFGGASKPSMITARPGSAFSYIPAPKPLKDCGADKK